MSLSTERAAIPALVITPIVVGVFVGVVATAAATVFLARDALHLACSYADGWICADGISYLGIGAVLCGVPTLLAIVGAARRSELIPSECRRCRNGPKRPFRHWIG